MVARALNKSAHRVNAGMIFVLPTGQCRVEFPELEPARRRSVRSRGGLSAAGPHKSVSYLAGHLQEFPHLFLRLKGRVLLMGIVRNLSRTWDDAVPEADNSKESAEEID